MSRTSSLPYDQRMKNGAGELAEKAFEDYAKQRGIRYVRYGFNQPDIYFQALPEFLRLTPDFACTFKSKAFLVECKGAGRSRFVNIKTRDMSGLKLWSELSSVYFFINDTDRRRVSMIDFNDVHNHLSEFEIDAWENDGNTFYKVPKTFFTWKDKHATST